MEQYLRPELVMGLLAVLAIGLQIAVQARSLFAVRADREPVPRGEYDRDQAEVRARVAAAELALHKRVDDACARLDGLLDALHELRVEVAGLTASLRVAHPQFAPKGDPTCRPVPNPATRPRNSG